MKTYFYTADNPPLNEWVVSDAGFVTSSSPLEALYYAPGSVLNIAELDGFLQTCNKLNIGRCRKVLATIDVSELLRDFALWCAFPGAYAGNTSNVVHHYLATGDNSLRSEAQVAINSASVQANTEDALKHGELALTVAWASTLSDVRRAARCSKDFLIQLAEFSGDDGTVNTVLEAKFQAMVDKAFTEAGV